MKLVLYFLFLHLDLISTHGLPPDMEYLAETMNPELDEQGQKFFEGDMILNKEQLEIINSETTDRGGDNRLSKRWPNKTFIFKISNELANMTDHIQTAIQNWQSKTCISFVAATGKDRLFAHFKPSDGCSSRVGYQDKEQPINIDYGCREYGTIEHEIGHALGLFHEQSRPDRDEFVTVFLDNIKSSEIYNFDKHQTINTYDIPYDINSIMHYGRKDFTKNGEDTLVANNPLNYFRMGQRFGISFYDFKLVNLMYNCSGNCPNPPICQNEGYVNTMCACACPLGVSGVNCEIGQEIPPSHYCTFNVNTTGIISSPSFPTKTYREECVWRITAPEGQRVRIHFRSFNFRPPIFQERCTSKRDWCYYEHLELRMVDLLRGEKFCGTQLNDQTVASTSNVAALLLVRKKSLFPGFEADVQFIN